MFLSEPRYARAMVPCTLLQLTEIAEGFLQFTDVLCNLNGGVLYGDLLPGSNYIGPNLKNAQPLTGAWLQVQEIQQVVLQRVPNLLTQTVQNCALKDMRMTYGDSPVYQSVSGKPCHESTLALTDPQAAKAPEYQVLMKELFTIFLRLLTFYEKWSSDQGYVEVFDLGQEPPPQQLQIVPQEDDDDAVPLPQGVDRYDQDF